jgi:hypothetical protein
VVSQYPPTSFALQKKDYLPGLEKKTRFKKKKNQKTGFFGLNREFVREKNLTLGKS